MQTYAKNMKIYSGNSRMWYNFNDTNQNAFYEK